MTNSIPADPTRYGRQIRALAAKDPSIITDFGGAEKFEATVAKIGRLDTQFENAGGVFFELGADAEETARRFTQIHIEQYRDGARPSLAALVAHHLDDIGLPAESPHYKAALLVAARAEVDLDKVPQYHNKNHYADVTAQVAVLVKHNNTLAAAGLAGAQALSPQEMAEAIIAAAAHDIDHPGGKNALPGEKPTAANRLRLEEKSFEAARPLLEKAGLDAKAIGDIHAMIQTTSPDGPHHVLQASAKALLNGETAAWSAIDPKNEYPELETLADKLQKSPKLTARAAMLGDADLGASAFQGLAANIKMSEVFTQELQERKYPDNVRGPGAWVGFSNFIVGSGPISLAAQDAVGANYTDMDRLLRARSNILKTIAIGLWQDDVLESGTPVSRVDASGLGAAQVAAMLEAMKDAGLKPTVQRDTDGSTVFRVDGGDVEKLRRLRREIIGQIDWSPLPVADGVAADRLITPPLGADETKALKNALKMEGASPIDIPPSVAVSGNDAGLVAEFQREAGRKKAAAAAPDAPAPRKRMPFHGAPKI